MKIRLLAMGLMLFSLILSACGSAEKSNFPTGKFIKSGETDYGLKFNPDRTFSVFQGETTYVTAPTRWMGMCSPKHPMTAVVIRM